MATAIEACKHNRKRGFTGLCEGCRSIADAAQFKGMAFTVERDGARIRIDPKFDIPNRGVAKGARLAMSEGDEVSEGVYPFLPLRRDAEGFSPLECDADAERIGTRMLLDARGTAERAAYGEDARMVRRIRVKRVARIVLRRWILDPAARTMRFGRKMLARESAPLARYARVLCAAFQNAMTEGAQRIRTIIATSRAPAHALDVIVRGWSRAVDTAARMLARIEGREMPTLSGRGSAMSLCREARAFDGVSLTGYTTFAEAREALARGEIDPTGPLAARLEGDDASPLQSVGACLSPRKVRGSRARNKRAADALARSEALRIEREREGRAAMLVPLAMYDVPLLMAELSEAIEGARLLKAKTARSKGKGAETGAIRRANCYISAIRAELSARQDEATRQGARRLAAAKGRLATMRRSVRMGTFAHVGPCATPPPIVVSRSGAVKMHKENAIDMPRPSGELTCIVGGEGYKAFQKRAIAYGYTPMGYAAPMQESPTPGFKGGTPNDGTPDKGWSPDTFKGPIRESDGPIPAFEAQVNRAIRRAMGHGFIVWTRMTQIRVGRAWHKERFIASEDSDVRASGLALRLMRIRERSAMWHAMRALIAK